LSTFQRLIMQDNGLYGTWIQQTGSSNGFAEETEHETN